MKGSLLVLGFLVLGIVSGMSGFVPDWVNASVCARYFLYLLIALIGFEFGYGGLVDAMKNFRIEYLCLPLGTMVGTLAFTAVIGLVAGGYSLRDYMAIGSGFGYYSLSSVLIIDLRQEDVGLQLAVEMGTIALLTNITREIFALLFAPIFRKVNSLAPISAGGVASIDVVLPAIIRVSGKEFVPAAIIHGVIIEISVPILVTLFCS